MPYVYRLVKGSRLTHAELDGNFTQVVQDLAGKAAIGHTHSYEPVGAAAAAVAAHELVADPHPQYMTSAESAAAFDPLGAGTAAVTVHELAADPHPQYMTSAESAAAFSVLGHTHAFAEITDKPLTYPPDPHVAHDHISLTPQVDPGHGEAHIWYDSERHALSYKTDIPNTSMQIGFENWVRVRNTSGAMIPDGSAVVITGASGQNPTIALANATDHGPSRVLGLVTADIANNAQGYVTTFGELNGLNTSGWAEGTVLYLSATVPGALTPTPPTHPQFVIAIARVLYSHVSQGKILMTVRDAKSYDHEGAADDAVAAHEALADPHPGYLTPAEGDAAYAAAAHDHAIAEVTGLQDALDGKAPSGHDHDAAYAGIENAYNLGNATGAVTLNATNGELQYATSTGATTWTLDGAEAAPLVTSITLELTNGGAFTQTWPSSATLKWDSGTAPTLTAAGVDILVFYSRDGGTTWRGFLAAKDSK